MSEVPASEYLGFGVRFARMHHLSIYGKSGVGGVSLGAEDELPPARDYFVCCNVRSG